MSKDSLVVLHEPLDRLVNRLLERSELERLRSSRVDEPQELLVRRRLSELSVRLGGVELFREGEKGVAGEGKGSDASSYGLKERKAGETDLVLSLEADSLHNGVGDSLDRYLLVLSNLKSDDETSA